MIRSALVEELGLIGSARYVAQHSSERLAAMLNFDINAFGDTVVFGPSTAKENVALRRTFVTTCANEDLPCGGFSSMPPGDDRSFVKAGVPTISVGILPVLQVHQLWLMMNGVGNSGLAEGFVPAIFKTLHSADDTVDKPFPFPAVARCMLQPRRGIDIDGKWASRDHISVSSVYTAHTR